MVECKLCKVQFPMSGNDHQGHGCASAIYHKDGVVYIHGFYGSRLFDMRRYKFIGSEMRPIPKEPINPVCDVCVEELVRLEAIVFDRDCEP